MFGERRAILSALWIAGRRRFITIRLQGNLDIITLWIAGRRRFITIMDFAVESHNSLWIAGRRRFITMPRYLPSACAFSSLAEWRAGDFDDALNHRAASSSGTGNIPKSPTFTSSQRARSLTLLLRLPYLLLALSDATL